MDQLDRIGRYDPIKLLGRGGMGEVYLARDPLIDRLVAVKLLGAAFDAEARERFTREARAAGRLQHEHIVTIFDVGEHEGRPFIAMEYVPGETLAALIRQATPPPRAELLALLDDACEGLAYAHRAGVAHLDVKPENLIRHADGPLKILDFGIARVIAADETHTRHVLGTLRYMSPEQLSGGEVDHRSDVFGIGCVLFEMVTGQPAFGATWPEVMARLNGAEVPRPSDLVPGLPPELDRIALKAMAFAPADRYDDLEALRADLADVRPLVEGAPVRSNTAAVPSSSKRTARPPTVVAPAPAAPRWRTALVAAGVVLAAGLWIWRGTATRGPIEQVAPTFPTQGASQAPATPEPATGGVTPSTFASEVWQAVARREHRAALGLLQAQPELAPGLIAELSGAAAAAVADARRTAEARGRSARESADYRVGVEALARARRLDAGGPSVDGLAALWEAADAFTRATPPAAVPKQVDAAPPPASTPSDMVKRALETAEQAQALARPNPAPPAPAPGSTVTADPSRSIVIAAPSVPLPDAAPPRPPVVEPPPRAAPPAAATPEAGARAALSAYEAAYRSRDIAALRRVFPAMSAAQTDALTRTFAEAISYGLDVRVVNLVVGEATVTATCEVTHALVPKVGSPSRTTQTARVQLAPMGATWVIQRIDAAR
jgi:predicted Ser/Thr protein kinase